MSNQKRKPSFKLLQAGGLWSVETSEGITDNLSESMGWEHFFSSRSVNAKLFRDGKVMASRDFSSPLRVQHV